MRMLKFKKAPIIVALVMCAILLIVGIVFALLPEETYISWGDYDSASTRYYPLIFCGLFAFIFFLIAWITATTQMKSIARINEMMQNLGEDAIILGGAIVDREAARENAKKTALSILGGILSALILGVGVYRIHGNNNARYFILYSEGMYIVNMRDKSELLIEKMKISDIKITEKPNSLLMEFLPAHFTFTVNTRGLDISAEELIAKFKEVFTNPIPDPFQNV
ncbi:MAG: hypothetical protein J1G02_05360 [Clostridiales bacterium]|nr:hypothetical protein [Clostridiales bacterium]